MPAQLHQKRAGKDIDPQQLTNQSFSTRNKSTLLGHSTSLDLRPIEAGLLSPQFVSFDMELKKLVNPNNQNSVWIQGAAGAGLARILLSTNASRLYFIEQTAIDANRLATLVDPLQIRKKLKYKVEYYEHKRSFGFALMAGSPRQLAEDLYCELMALGVQLVKANGNKNIQISKQANSPVVNIDFSWAYMGEKAKHRRVTYIQADLIEPETYISLISQKEKNGVNGYYQIAAYESLNVADRYLPQIANQIVSGGFVLIDPRKNLGTNCPYRFNHYLRNTKRRVLDPFLDRKNTYLRSLFNNKLRFYGQAVRPYQLFSSV